MSRSQLDHIVIAAPSLAVGIDYVRRVLGVTPQMGGEHPRMGTHNRFLRLGQKVYLEVISINPKAPHPGRPRWFGLDHMQPDELPRVATWVARTEDIEIAASASPLALGNVESMSRGQFHWRITIPEDGSLPCNGIAPSLIQWPPGTHPTGTLDDLGCSLLGLEGFHPDVECVSAILASIRFDGEFSLRPLPLGQQPYLVAHIRTPTGLCQLGGGRS